MRYRRLRKYKYQLTEPYAIDLEGRFPDTPRPMKEGRFVSIIGGWLFLRKGYAWDGPSGPTFDTPSFMRGSLVHDALYQLIREGQLGVEHRKAADQLLRRICREDGMSAVRAWWVYQAVRIFGGEACRGPVHGSLERR